MITTPTVTTVERSATGAGIMYMHVCTGETVPFRDLTVYSPLEPGIPLESGVVVSGPNIDDAAVSDVRAAIHKLVNVACMQCTQYNTEPNQY